MDKFKEMCKKILKSKYLPFILFFIFTLILHHFLFFSRDDLVYAKSKYGFFEYFPHRYNTWSSRLIIETTLIQLVKHNIIIWKVLDSLVWTLGIFMIMKLINKKESQTMNFIGCCVFLLYSFLDMCGAGWVATTLNYMWPFAFGMTSFLPLINKENNKKTSIILYVLSILALIYATNQEQSCAVIVGINFLCLIYEFVKNKKFDKYNIFCLIISILSLIFIFACPGNAARARYEAKINFPKYSKLSIFSKIYLGIVPTFRLLISSRILLVLLSVMLMIGTLFYAKHYFSKILAISTTIFLTIITFFSSMFSQPFDFSELISILSLEKMPDAFSKKDIFITFFISIMIFAIFTYLILVIFRKKQLLPVFVFLAGITSKIIMGFSPTVFISGPRTGLFMYMSFIIVIIFIIYKLYDDKKINKHFDLVLKSSLLSFAMLSYLYVLMSLY